jgi:DNA polymerase (family 10)
MEADAIAALFEEMAVLVELSGDNPFKARAYSRAARIILEHANELKKLSGEGQLTSIDGIGENIARKITLLLADEKVDEFERMIKDTPWGVREMLGVQGLGPRRVKYLWKEYGIKSLSALELACRRRFLSNKPKFGEKIEANILKGIEVIRRNAGQWLLSDGLESAIRIRDALRELPSVDKIEIAGSIRRRKELVRDIDVLVASRRPGEVMEAFVRLPDAGRVVERGDTKSEIVLSNGMQCDLRVVSSAQFPFALQHFTGSKDHNVKLRGMAKGMGLKMNEYGLFKGTSQRSMKLASEAAIYKKLGLAYIEPELREDMGEIEAAMDGHLPNLIEEDDVKGVFHVHTSYSDGLSSIGELADVARGLGYKYMVVADHSVLMKIAGGMDEDDVLRQHLEIDCLNKATDDFKILKGIEVDILADGSLDYSDGTLKSFDMVIASVHTKFSMNKDDMTRRIVCALENPFVHALAHPTGRLLLAREPYQVDIQKVIEAAAASGKVLELNAHPQRVDLDWRWLKFAKESGVKIVISTDAHSKDGIACTRYGVWMARKGWLGKGDVINCMAARELMRFLRGL